MISFGELAKKPISELDPIGDNQLSSALVEIEQDDQFYNAPVVPNSPRQINILSQGQLEAQFGTDIEIPDGESYLLSIQESFTLPKPIKLGEGSSLRIEGQVSSITITYTGAGAMFQNTDPTKLIGSFDIRQIAIVGDFTNTAFDLIGTSFFFINTIQIIGFDNIGVIDMLLVEINSLGIFVCIQGLIIKDASAVSINVVFSDQTGLGDTGMTLFSFIQSVPALIILDDIRAINSADESIVFFDPNAPVDTFFVITNATKTLGNLFQPGADIPAEADFGAPGSPTTEFHIIAHNIVKGQVVVLKNFINELAYNGTFIAFDPFSINFVDILVLFTIFDNSGTMSAKSLDSTDVLVFAFNNPGEPDSMLTAESGYEDSGAANTIINTAGTPEVIVNANFAFSNLEGFKEGIVNEGQVVALDLATRRYAVNYSGSMSKGGNAAIMGLVLLKNSAQVGFNPPRSPSGTSTQIGGITIIELSKSDTLQVGVVNYTNEDNIKVTYVDLTINRA
jgi:hypothetical protein